MSSGAHVSTILHFLINLSWNTGIVNLFNARGLVRTLIKTPSKKVSVDLDLVV